MYSEDPIHSNGDESNAQHRSNQMSNNRGSNRNKYYNQSRNFTGGQHLPPRFQKCHETNGSMMNRASSSNQNYNNSDGRMSYNRSSDAYNKNKFNSYSNHHRNNNEFHRQNTFDNGQNNRPYRNTNYNNSSYRPRQYNNNYNNKFDDSLSASFDNQLKFEGESGRPRQYDAPRDRMANYNRFQRNDTFNQRSNNRNHYDQFQLTSNSNNKPNSAMKPQANLSNKDESQHEIMDELLRNANYECIICCEMIQIIDKTWNCTNCFNVFHLACIQAWARKCSLDDTNSVNNSNLNVPNNSRQNNVNSNQGNGNQVVEEWRCPTCQDVNNKIPFAYYCFCGKRKNPEKSNYHVPHSCGEVCSRSLKLFNNASDLNDSTSINEKDQFCPHKCTLKCHPGKCPPCQLKSMRSCACNKTKILVNCASKASEVKCDQICGKILSCGNDTCERKCHNGACEPCTKRFDIKCKCGKLVRSQVLCNERFEVFTCEEKCQKKLPCGFHKCSQTCHSDDCGQCPFEPVNVQYCPCKKVHLSQLPNVKKRLLCIDPIPTCSNVCEKLLDCGNEKEPHNCKSTCHSGSCPPCPLSTILRCECKANSQKFECKDLAIDQKSFKCKKRCNKKLSCGRHKCLNLCCTDKEHLCKNKCGRKLSCGLHNCNEPCHNKCASCPNIIWEEVTCNCGSQVLYPPLPCNTKKPLCNKPCPKNHSCDHPPTHQCTPEDDTQQCPPCTQFVSKMCYGGHELRHSILCYQTKVSCGRFCMKALPCGHNCQKICHDGTCPPCSSKCGHLRSDCSHTCQLLCHFNTSVQCPKSLCREKIKVYCKCDFKSKELECNQVNDATIINELRENLISKFSFNTAIQLDEIEAMVEYNTLHQLECDDKCAREKRSKDLAEAFGCERTKYITKYSDFLKSEAKRNPQFIKNLHDRFVSLINNFKKSGQKSVAHSFPPMNKNNREVIHHLAAYYNLVSQSYDHEPNRNVIVTANSTSRLPDISLLESVNIDPNQNRIKVNVTKAMTSSVENQNKKNIDYFNFEGIED